MSDDDKLTPQQKLDKRVRAHAQTVGVWLASTQARLDGETPEQHADRVYHELRDQHARSGGPSQRMKDAVAFYHRTVKVEGKP